MLPYIRRYNYISDYYWTMTEWAEQVAAYPVSYYSVDWGNSIYDKDLMAASYEKYGLGDMSGMRWKKIQMVPVYQIEEIQPQHSADEKGLTLKDSEISSFVVSDKIGILPSEWDFIHFHQDFMFKASDYVPLFVVKNVDIATYGSITFHRPSIKVASQSSLVKLEKQISERYMFLELTKKIHEVQTASLLLKLQQKNELLTRQLENLFHRIGFYLVETT